MATNAANSEKLKQEVGQVFELLQEQITKVHGVCLQRRREIECCVQQCRALLKPWPLKSSMDKKVDDSCKQYPEERLANEELTTQEEKGNNKTEEAEKQDLAVLDSLLAKAQRAREALNKIDETDVSNNKKTKTSKKPLPIPNKVPDQQVKKQASTKTSKPSSTRSVPVRRPASQKAPMKSTYSASYGRPLTAKSTRNKPPTIRSSAKVFVDSVVKKGASERVKHSAAREKGLDPSKTAVGPSLDKNQSEETQCHDLQCEEGFSYSSAETIYPVVSKPKGGSSSSSRDLKESDREIAPTEDAKRSTESAGVGPSSFSHAATQELHSCLDTQSLNNEGLSNQNEGFFDHFAEGSGISLPGKYRKLKAASATLYSELRRVRGKVHKPSSSPQHFIGRLEARFDAKTAHNHEEIHEETCHVLREHEKLSTLTEAVVCRTNNLTASSSWQETYKCYRHWQIVLSRFNELQRKTQQLLEAEEQLLTFCPCGNCSAFDQDISQDTASTRGQSYSREGCVLLSNWLPAGIEDRALAESAESAQQWNDTNFTYASVKELHRLVTLQHEVQLLCFQLYLEEQAGKKLLPLLEQLDPADSLFVPLYRVIYGFLCGGGRVFPAMVLDNFS